MRDAYRALMEAYLPEAFIKDRFIIQNGGPMNYSYEDYLIEILNNSKWFMEKTKMETFHKPLSEAHGENDAVTKQYEIDFKCILSSSMQRARDATSPQIKTNSEKSAIYFTGSKKEGNFESYKIHGLLKGSSVSELEKMVRLERNDSKSSDAERDLYHFANVIDKKKNLFLYYPALLYFREEGFNVFDACDCLFNSYKLAFDYRRKNRPLYETYIGFYYDGDMCIVYDDGCEGKLVDQINPRYCSPTFEDLYRMHDTVFLHQILGAFT